MSDPRPHGGSSRACGRPPERWRIHHRRSRGFARSSQSPGPYGRRDRPGYPRPTGLPATGCRPRHLSSTVVMSSRVATKAGLGYDDARDPDLANRESNRRFPFGQKHHSLDAGALTYWLTSNVSSWGPARIGNRRLLRETASVAVERRAASRDLQECNLGPGDPLSLRCRSLPYPACLGIACLVCVRADLAAPRVCAGRAGLALRARVGSPLIQSVGQSGARGHEGRMRPHRVRAASSEGQQHPATSDSNRTSAPRISASRALATGTVRPSNASMACGRTQAADQVLAQITVA